MLNQLFTAADIAADHRRTLLAEAEAHRLARQASAKSDTRTDCGNRTPLFGLPLPWRARGAT